MRARKFYLYMTLLPLVLSGCAAADWQETAMKEQAPVTVTATVKQSRYTRGLEKMIEKLSQEENIIVECQVVPDEQSSSIIKMRASSYELTDMVDSNFPDLYNQIDASKYLEDLSDETWVEKLKHPEIVTYQDKVYAFPFQSMQGIHGMVYNQEVFERAGIEKIPESWEELLEVCETISRELPDVVPVCMAKESWITQVLPADAMTKALGITGSEQYARALMDKTIKWTDIPAFSEVLDHYMELFSKGYVNEDYLSFTYENCVEAVGNGTAAMHFNGSFFAGEVQDQYPGARLGMFNVIMPNAAEDMATANMYSVGFALSNTSKKKDVVKKIFCLWSTPEYADLYFRDTPGFPAFDDVDGGSTPYYLADMKEKYIDSDMVSGDFLSKFDSGRDKIMDYLWIYLLEEPKKQSLNGREILERFQTDYEQ